MLQSEWADAAANDVPLAPSTVFIPTEFIRQEI
jgi:hypothetical protein